MKFTNKTLISVKKQLRQSLACMKAFTLIELLVVIVVIGILASIPIMNFASQLKKARDTERKSDLKEYQTALTGYSIKHKGLYPSYTEATDLSGASLCSTALGLPNCPDDPSEANSYKYISNGSGNGMSDATEYVTWSIAENNPSYFWVTCSNGASGYTTTEPTDSNCPTLTASITGSSSAPPTTPPTTPPTFPPTTPPTAPPSLTPVPTGTVTFDYTGSTQTFTVPSGVTKLSVKVWGAGGGSYYVLRGGQAGYSYADLNVIPGENLTILVGGAGQNPTGSGYTGGLGGYGGGGRGGNGAFGYGGGAAGGGGGGRSEILRGSTSLIVAGGGGGSMAILSNSKGGIGGGITGGDGIGETGTPAIFLGKGGTQMVGGAGGGGVYPGESGSRNTGGNAGGSNFGGGGGGGGGYYGGGGGAARKEGDVRENKGSGGGGSGYVPSGGTTMQGVGSDPDRGSAGNPSQNGRVIIPY